MANAFGFYDASKGTAPGLANTTIEEEQKDGGAFNSDDDDDSAAGEYGSGGSGSPAAFSFVSPDCAVLQELDGVMKIAVRELLEELKPHTNVHTGEVQPPADFDAILWLSGFLKTYARKRRDARQLAAEQHATVHSDVEAMEQPMSQTAQSSLLQLQVSSPSSVTGTTPATSPMAPTQQTSGMARLVVEGGPRGSRYVSSSSSSSLSSSQHQHNSKQQQTTK
jgi:hypothetical protein